MTNIEEQVIIQAAFFNELEKNASLATAFFKGVGYIGKALGKFGKGEKLLNYANDMGKAVKATEMASEAGTAVEGAGVANTILEQGKNYASPVFTKTKAGISASAPANMEHGFVQSHVQDATEWLHNLGKGVGEQETFGGAAKQFAKNFWGAEKQEYARGAYKADLFKDLPDAKKTYDAAGNVTHIKRFGFKRKVIGNVYDVDNPTKVIGGITKKMLPTRLLNYSMTPTGMIGTGVAGAALTGGNPAEGAKEGFKDSLLWTPATKGLGAAKFFGYDLPKMLF